MDVHKEILKILKGLEYRKYEHEKALTSEEAARVRGTKIEEAMKALIVKLSKVNNDPSSARVIQCLIPGNERLDLKKVRKLCHAKNASLVSPHEVEEITFCKPGSVPPFGILWGIEVIADRSFENKEYVVFSAGTHYDSIRMKYGDWKRIVNPKIDDIIKRSLEKE